MGVGLAILLSPAADGLVAAEVAESVSSSGLYPSFAIRSASSRAFFSASSKSKPTSAVTFLAPSFVFFAPRILGFRGPAAEDAVFRIAVEETVRGVDVGPALSDELRGDFGRTVLLPLEPAVRKGDAVLLPTGGVAVREGGLLGRLMVGLSQEEKKSSSGSPAGVCAPEAAESSISFITHSFGYLGVVSIWPFDIYPFCDPQLLVRSHASSQLFFVFDCSIRGVFCFGVFAIQCSGAAVRLKVFGRGLVAADLHNA